MADIIYINEEEGVKRVVNNGKLYAKLLTKFKDDKNLENLIASADSHDWESAKVSVHTLKGTAANLALTELFNKSLEVETQIKTNSFNPDSLEKLKICFAETLIQIDKVIVKHV